MTDYDGVECFEYNAHDTVQRWLSEDFEPDGDLTPLDTLREAAQRVAAVIGVLAREAPPGAFQRTEEGATPGALLVQSLVDLTVVIDVYTMLITRHDAQDN